GEHRARPAAASPQRGGVAPAQLDGFRQNIGGNDLEASLSGEEEREVLRAAQIEHPCAPWELELPRHVGELRGAPVAHREDEALEAKQRLGPQRRETKAQARAPDAERRREWHG